MKYLVLGCNGMLGHVVSLYLNQRGHQVIGVGRKSLNIGINTRLCDLRNLKAVSEIIQEDNFDFIVNCAGVLNADAEKDKANAVAINSLLPHFLSHVTTGTNTRVIHVSTDCVFSGKDGGYSENSFKDGSDFYARSKALGEIENQKDITIRTSIVGPDINPNGVGLFNWFMKQKKEIKGYSKAIWTGQTNVQLAKTIEYASEKQLFGLFNVVPTEPIDKLSLLKLFNEYCRGSSVSIQPDSSVVIDKSLTTLRCEFEHIVPDYHTMVLDMVEWIQVNPTLYPHYIPLQH